MHIHRSSVISKGIKFNKYSDKIKNLKLFIMAIKNLKCHQICLIGNKIHTPPHPGPACSFIPQCKKTQGTGGLATKAARAAT